MNIASKITAWLGLVAVLISGSVAAPADVRAEIFPVEGISAVAIKVKFHPFTQEQEWWTAEFNDPGRFGKLVDVLSGAIPSKDHKCADVGTVTLKYGNGEPVVLGILPGHDDQVYQFRLYGGEGYTIHQVDRAGFLAALQELGCPVDDPGFPG